MEPHLLIQLSVIIDEGTFTKASETLALSQPSLSRNMKILEDRVGEPVLKRGRFGVMPTPLGDILAQEGRAIHTAVRNARVGLDQWNAGYTSLARVGITPTMGASVVPKFLQQYLETESKIFLRVREANAAQLLASLLVQEIDFAIGPSDVGNSRPEVTCETMFRDRLAIFAGPRHPLAKAKDVSSDQLRDCTWIGFGEYSHLYQRTMDYLASLGIADVRPNIICNLSVALNLIVDTEECVAALPQVLATAAGNRDRLVQLNVPEADFYRDMGIWWRKDVELSPPQKRLLATMRSFFEAV